MNSETKEEKVIKFNDFDNLTKEEQEKMKEEYELKIDCSDVVIGSEKYLYLLNHEDYRALELVTTVYEFDGIHFPSEEGLKAYIDTPDDTEFIVPIDHKKLTKEEGIKLKNCRSSEEIKLFYNNRGIKYICCTKEELRSVCLEEKGGKE